MITKRVGNRIKFLRNQMGLSQEKLALKAGIDRTYLAGIESGKRNATIISVLSLIRHLPFFAFDLSMPYIENAVIFIIIITAIKIIVFIIIKDYFSA